MEVEIDETYVRKKGFFNVSRFKLAYPDLLLLVLSFLCCIVLVSVWVLMTALDKYSESCRRVEQFLDKNAIPG